MTHGVQSKIYFAGHKGMVGSAIVRQLLNSGLNEQNVITRTREELDLTNQQEVRRFFEFKNLIKYI